MRRRDLAQRGGVHAPCAPARRAGGRRSLAPTGRTRAMARLVRMLAELVARLQLQHPQAGRGLRVQRVQRPRQRAARGGQEEQLVQAGLGRPSSGNKVPTRAGRRLRQQAAAIARLAVPSSRWPLRNSCGKRTAASARPVRSLPRPGQVAHCALKNASSSAAGCVSTSMVSSSVATLTPAPPSGWAGRAPGTADGRRPWPAPSARRGGSRARCPGVHDRS